MPKSIYETIYKDLKQKIESDVFAYQELLPSENTLIQTYHCSRNTLRRAVSRLVSDGYVQTMQGKGVRNIYQPAAQTAFTIGEIESFRESALRNGHSPLTKVLLFTEFAISEKQAAYTGFPVGTDIYYIQRLHYLDNIPLILNHNASRPFGRDCGKLDLRLSGKHTAHDDREQQTDHDGGKNNTD